MKPIPEALRAYFPDKWCPDRPWWKASWQDDVNDFTFKRPDGYGTALLSDREEIDRAHPMQPPPILVGQVWASPLSGGRWRVSVIAGVVHESDGTLTITFANDRFEPGSWLHSHSILLTCPFGCAPWSGPEVP